MSNILDKIFADKQKELAGTKRKLPLPELKVRMGDQAPVRDVFKALNGGKSSKIIAEIKRRTPFKGELRENFNAVEIAGDYARNGAATLSILTETNYFGSHIGILKEVRPIAPIPLLRKDFIFDEYQVYESRAHGADLFLLIATWLEQSQLTDLLSLGKELGLPALVETHNEYDMEKAFESKASLIGINNRDLTNGKTDLNISRRLIPMALQEPGSTLVCESGISGREEIEEFEGIGVHAFLIGESLMTVKNIPEKLKELLGNGKTTGKS
ncbi:MAG: indole-3-glycerol phosphate synthase TrpC [Nitrospinae bacterium]|nr:indole-3-glycerol phosphate synthase TrpC [Nitrospinota bacterium]MBL7020228.1 indole-3-glycerol phosphate synthase TrpC [Nitrospinaceae bacterium]